MKTLVCDAPGQFSYQEKNQPKEEKGKTILKIRRVGICGTDLHAYEGTQPFFSYPRILGHEIAADLIHSNGKEGFEENEAVTIVPYFHCGKCLACRSGLTNCCAQIKVCGVHIDGAMVEYLSVPSSSLIHGQGLSYEELAMVEPLAIGYHGVRRANIKEGENVLVAGAGPIGLGIIALAKIAGAHVTVMDVNEQRLDFCKNTMGVSNIVNPMLPDTTEKLMHLTKGEMYSSVIDATGSQKAINDNFQYLAHGGRYVLVGLQKGEITFSHPEFHKREATLMSSRNATRADFDYIIKCLMNKQLIISVFLTHLINFNEVKDQFSSFLNPESGVIKAMVKL